MLMALVTWMMMKLGLAPSPEDFARMAREFRERGHHVTLDFGKQTTGVTRWTSDDWQSRPCVGLGYEYYVDRRFHGVGFEVLAQSVGPIFKPDRDVNAFFLGGGLAYYPHRSVRLFTQAGAEIGVNGSAQTVGRLGIGYRFLFFKLGMQPFFYVQQTSTNRAGWSLAFRFEY
jgi:hypothetical protein